MNLKPQSSPLLIVNDNCYKLVSKVIEVFRMLLYTCTRAIIESIFLLHPSMFSCEKIFVDFIDQLSPQHSHRAELIGLQSRRIQRSLRSIDAAQGGCWTAPCSPTVPASRKISSTQSEAPVIRDAPCAEVPRWHGPTLFPVTSEVLNSLKISRMTS